jgi:hypothetical protein
MLPLKRNTRIEISFLGVLWLFGASSVLASEPHNEVSSTQDAVKKAQVCGVLQDFDGKVQVLDSSRSVVIDSESQAAIPCEGWISVQSGWASVRHVDGAQIQLGSGTFLRLDRTNRDEPFVLYRGQVHVEVGHGAKSLKLLTANARVDLESGRAIVLYREDQEETQLMGLDRVAHLRSRFDADTQVEVGPGFESHIDTKALRLTPSSPSRMLLVDIDLKMKELHLSIRDRTLAIKWAKRGQERAQNEFRHARRLAGLVFESSDYVRHKASPEDDALKSKLRRSMTGGSAEGDSLSDFEVHRKTASAETARILVDKKKKEDDQEKRKLIDRLSRMGAE